VPPSSHSSSRVAIGAVCLAFSTLSAPVAFACSICRCGDPTFNALGKDGYSAEGLRIAFDWDRFDKDEGDPAVEAESQVENRFTTLVSYGFNNRFRLVARVPFSVRDLTASSAEEGTTRVHTQGLSDPELYGQLRLWSSALSGGLGRRSSLSLTAGVKTPWGRNHVEQNGERVDEHAQPGTGSTDLFGTAAFLYLIDKRSSLFLSGGYRHTGENDFGYRYGSTTLANLAYERKLSRILDGVLELNFRHAAKDQVDAQGTLDDDTGGSLLYVTPRVLVDLGKGVVLRSACQIPVARSLSGFQKERAVFTVAFTYLVPR